MYHCTLYLVCTISTHADFSASKPGPKACRQSTDRKTHTKKEIKKKGAHISCIRLTVVHPSDDVVTKLAPRHVLKRQTIRLVPLVKPPHLHQVAVLKTRQDAGLRQPTSSAQRVANKHGGTNTFTKVIFVLIESADRFVYHPTHPTDLPGQVDN